MGLGFRVELNCFKKQRSAIDSTGIFGLGLRQQDVPSKTAGVENQMEKTWQMRRKLGLWLASGFRFGV